jgi:hypothetical protein
LIVKKSVSMGSPIDPWYRGPGALGAAVTLGRAKRI